MTSQSNPIRLLLRNIDQLQASRLLLALPPAAPLDELAALLPEAELSVFTTLNEAQQSARQTLPEQRVCYAHTLAASFGQFDGIVLFLQKSRPLVSAMIDMLCTRLTDSGQLFLVGENGTGIKSWKKKLAAWGEVESLANGCHSGLLSLMPNADARNAGKEPQMEQFGFTLADTAMTVCSLPGVFSHGRLDVGTRLLLETLASEKIAGRLLDFGCGAGIIGNWLGLRNSGCHPTLVDTDAMALESSRQTLAANNIEGQVIASHGLAAVTGQYDWIISNPPFHEGVKTRYDVTEAFLGECRQHLARGGQLRIVANSFLKYPPLIEQAFGHCQVLARRDGFTIYGATAGAEFRLSEI